MSLLFILAVKPDCTFCACTVSSSCATAFFTISNLYLTFLLSSGIYIPLDNSSSYSPKPSDGTLSISAMTLSSVLVSSTPTVTLAGVAKDLSAFKIYSLSSSAESLGTTGKSFASYIVFTTST